MYTIRAERDEFYRELDIRFKSNQYNDDDVTENLVLKNKAQKILKADGV